MYDKELVKNLKNRNLTVFEEVHSIKFEPHYGCNRNCTYCGMSRVSKGKMTKETFINTLKGVTSKVKKMSFSLHGEPTLNENLWEFCSIIREKYPKVQTSIISNTDIFRKIGFKELINLYESGVTQIHADLYSKNHGEWFFQELIKNKNYFIDNNIPVYDYYKDRINTFSYKGPNKRFLVITKDYEDLNQENICTRDMHTWGGNLDLKKWPINMINFPMKRTCTEPLKYATVRWNGDVTLCCRDGGRSLNLGNVNEKSLTDIWQGDNFQVVRFLCKIPNRKYVLPCILCNYRSFRDGLYPYWGREYSKEEILKVLNIISPISYKEPLYENLIEFTKTKELINPYHSILENTVELEEPHEY